MTRASSQKVSRKIVSLELVYREPCIAVTNNWLYRAKQVVYNPGRECTPHHFHHHHHNTVTTTSNSNLHTSYCTWVHTRPTQEDNIYSHLHACTTIHIIMHTYVQDNLCQSTDAYIRTRQSTDAYTHTVCRHL